MTGKQKNVRDLQVGDLIESDGDFMRIIRIDKHPRIGDLVVMRCFWTARVPDGARFSHAVDQEATIEVFNEAEVARELEEEERLLDLEINHYQNPSPGLPPLP